MRRLTILSLLLTTPFMCRADSPSERNVAYFWLHQAAGLYEQYSVQKCFLGLNKAKNTLAKLNKKNLDPALAEMAKRLETWIRTKSKVPASSVEQFRIKMHEIAQEKGLLHRDDWHNLVAHECITEKSSSNPDKHAPLMDLPDSTQPKSSESL